MQQVVKLSPDIVSLRNLVIVTGVRRSGKFMLTPVITSLSDSENLRTDYTLEQFPYLNYINAMSDDLAEYLIRFFSTGQFIIIGLVEIQISVFQTIQVFGIRMIQVFTLNGYKLMKAIIYMILWNKKTGCRYICSIMHFGMQPFYSEQSHH